MPDTQSHGVRIHYEVAGGGPPLVLVHGWTASGYTNWGVTGWVDLLSPYYHVILPDLRGHGKSEKPHRKEAYSLPLLADDVLAVMDAAGVDRARIMGYSMGGMTALELLCYHSERFSAAVIGGMGAAFPPNRRRGQDCRDEEEGEAPKLPRNTWRTIRAIGSLARHYDGITQNAVWRGVFKGQGPIRDSSRLSGVKVPMLLVAGTRDPLCPGTRVLAEQLPNARRVTLSGRNHISAVRDPRFKEAVVNFFAENG